MPFEITWAVPKRVLLTTFSGILSASELQQFVQEIRQEMRSGENPIYHISNSLAMQKVEISLGALVSLVRSIPVFTGLAAQIDINHPRAINTMLAAIGGQLMHIETHTVPSLEAAVNLVKHIDHEFEQATWVLPSITATDSAAPGTIDSQRASAIQHP